MEQFIGFPRDCALNQISLSHFFVHAEAVRFQSDIILGVSDNSVGMDSETQKKIFELFFSSKGAEGTGLGLFVTQKIVEQHGGRIKARSVIGQGSMFRVSIPQRASAEGLRPECGTSALRAVLDAEK
jgi:K+-sensing histidine kinase KdpD